MSLSIHYTATFVKRSGPIFSTPVFTHNTSAFTFGAVFRHPILKGLILKDFVRVMNFSAVCYGLRFANLQKVHLTITKVRIFAFAQRKSLHTSSLYQSLPKKFEFRSQNL